MLLPCTMRCAVLSGLWCYALCGPALVYAPTRVLRRVRYWGSVWWSKINGRWRMVVKYQHRQGTELGYGASRSSRFKSCTASGAADRGDVRPCAIAHGALCAKLTLRM
eukprot:1271264-Rhodomonas_salina.1